jgi:hypothetical protein
MIGPFVPLLHMQLAMLDMYQRQLDALCDETALNEAIKDHLKTLLPLIRAQNTLGKEIVAMHCDQLTQYRRWLESTLGGSML